MMRLQSLLNAKPEDDQNSQESSVERIMIFTSECWRNPNNSTSQTSLGQAIVDQTSLDYSSVDNVASVCFNP
jgi:hypothetical protein